MFDLGRTLLQSLERSPGRIALVDGPRRLSYADWAGLIGGVQRGLADLGLKRGDYIVKLNNRKLLDGVLEGNTWQSSRSVKKVPFVGEVQGGLAVIAYGVQIGRAHV